MNQNSHIKRFPEITRWSFFFLLIWVFYLVYVGFVRSPHTTSNAYINGNTNVFGLNIPPNLSFCGEQIPADDYEVRLKLEKEFFSNQYWKKNSRIIFNRVSRWFPYIEPILKEEGVPEDFKYVAVIESHLTNSSSSAGASGFWQLVPVTAVNYGLTVNEEVDERLDVELATRAACKLIKDAYKRFNSWTLAAAAYNVGIGKLERVIDRQNESSYHNLVLNKETGEFIYRILAYKTLLASPEHFGLKPNQVKSLKKIPVKLFKVDSTITNLSFLAKKLKCSKAHLKLFNPWLKTETLSNNAGKVYLFKVPRDLKKDYSAYYLDLLPNQGEDFLPVRQPVSEAAPADSTSSAPKKHFVNYIVKQHETAADICSQFHMTEKELLDMNKLGSAREVIPGMSLLIPAPEHEKKSEKK